MPDTADEIDLSEAMADRIRGWAERERKILESNGRPDDVSDRLQEIIEGTCRTDPERSGLQFRDDDEAEADVPTHDLGDPVG